MGNSPAETLGLCEQPRNIYVAELRAKDQEMAAEAELLRDRLEDSQGQSNGGVGGWGELA